MIINFILKCETCAILNVCRDIYLWHYTADVMLFLMIKMLLHFKFKFIYYSLSHTSLHSPKWGQLVDASVRALNWVAG